VLTSPNNTNGIARSGLGHLMSYETYIHAVNLYTKEKIKCRILKYTSVKNVLMIKAY
jgi:hypothetical protein